MKNQLNALAAGLALGLLWGVVLMIWTWAALKWDTGMSSLELIAEWYPGYEVSAVGSFLGLLWGFVDGFVGGYISVWLYNFFARKLSK